MNRERNSIWIRSPAKINLALRIIRRRVDGYHEIETIMQMVSLYDTLYFEKKKDGIDLFCYGIDLSGGRDNLVYRAAEMIKEKARVKSGVKIILKKNIPIMAGLGGGSSNAAATLRGLNELWEIGLKPEELLPLACSLGSDVPFFLNGPRAYATGVGNLLSPLPSRSKLNMLLIKPNISISTAWAYKALNLSLTKDRDNIKIISQLILQGREEEIANYLSNDFEETIIRYYPIIGEIKRDLLEQGALGALMSGSGPTVFGIFPTHRAAVELCPRYSQKKMEVFVVETIQGIRGEVS
jgi:4-diphosphocytidyl-2-C-methyl-D-erythritol kinase